MRARLIGLLFLAWSCALGAQPVVPATGADPSAPHADARVQRKPVTEGLSKPGKIRASHVHAFTLDPPSGGELADVGVPHKGAPLRIGVSRPVSGLDSEAGTASSLDWERLADGSSVAALSITSPLASSVRAGLRVTSLPPDATLRIQAPDSPEVFEVSGQEVNDVIASNLDHGEKGPDARLYWTPLIEGPTVVIGIELPAGTDPAKVRISVPKVSHLVTSATKGFGVTQATSGSCEIDAMCSVSTWGPEMNAVARIIFSDGTSTFACSGTLLADQDTTSTIPYFLTANHCISTQLAASSLNTYWFYRSTSCNSGALGAYVQQAAGATLLYASNVTDTSFMRLNALPPSGTVYAGWYAGTPPAAGSGVTALHHPLADLLKISFGSVGGYLTCTPPDSTGGFSCSGASASSSTFYDVGWTSGITESGSSGSGLFLGNGLLIGQLYGGSGDCTAPGDDAYGRFDVAYNAALKTWLAVSSQTLTVSRNGTGTGTVTSAPAGISCGSTCTASFTSGTSVSLTANAASNSTFAGWSGACSGLSACTVAMGAAASVAATFTQNASTLTVTRIGNGTVASVPAGINCGATCSATYPAGTAVTLTATPAVGYVFSGWSGGCSGVGACSLTLNTGNSVTASFASIPSATAVNVALGSSGATVSASSTNAAYNLAAVINGDRTGANITSNAWVDDTRDVFPDWVRIDFAGAQTIDHVVVYSVQDNYTSPIEPTNTLTFTSFGLTDFDVQGWNGSAWVTLGSVTGNNLVKRIVSFPATTVSAIRVMVNNALLHYSRIVEIEAWTAGAAPPPAASTNVALASNGGAASASSTNAAYNLAAVNNGDRTGANLTANTWVDDTRDGFPDWVRIDFAGAQTIDHVVVYSVQDNYTSPIEPTDTLTFTSFGLTAFDVQGWNGSAWVTLGSVTGNNLVKRTVSFPAATVSAIRVMVNNALLHYSRIVEIEAWTTGSAAASSTNFALASNGGVASASTTNAAYALAAVNNGDRTGANLTANTWVDDTRDVFPDTVEIDFPAAHMIDHVVLYSVQDNYTAPVEPTDTMTFTSFGVTAFDVQGWNGSGWVTLGSVSGNNLVKRTVSFPATSISRVRVVVNNALLHYSRIVEIEAWGN
ncbi:MAG TPA: hypothetical protein VHQ02_13770 [Usitatibacter sp.]|nr:hypothetical protein [Usitatibacter sp.]